MLAAQHPNRIDVAEPASDDQTGPSEFGGTPRTHEEGHIAAGFQNFPPT